MKTFFDFLRMLLLLTLMAVGTGFLAYYSSEELIGKPRVIDGDSLFLNGQEIRLRGIDAPEYRQMCNSGNKISPQYPCGKRSAEFLRSVVQNADLVCRGHEFDKYDRLLANCKIGEKKVNQLMVEEGWAVSFGDYQTAEQNARDNKKGIWEGEFARPSQWRQDQREEAHSNWLSNLFDW